MNYAIIDVETSIINDGNPFSTLGKLCIVGVLDKTGYTCHKIEYDDEPYGFKLDEIQQRLDLVDYVIGFNLKFDLHWLRRYGIRVSVPCFDSQLAEFILGSQGSPYPSLDSCAKRLSLPSKLSIVSTEYWSNGVDTPAIPLDVLSEYNERDCRLTEQVFLAQWKEMSVEQRRLLRLQCEDLIVLEEMEWNGLKYDFKEAEKRSSEVQKEIEEIDVKLRGIVDVPCINWNSNDHLSAILYGGSVQERFRETYTKVLKNGKEKEVERWSERTIEFPTLVKPIKRTETAATKGLSDADLSSINQERSETGKRLLNRRWSVAEPVLRKLNAKGKARKIIDLMLRRSDLEKLDSTYYGGLIEKHRSLNWPESTIHGQFNQCVAATGRLSSSNPNLQNFAKEIKDLFYSRY